MSTEIMDTIEAAAVTAGASSAEFSDWVEGDPDTVHFEFVVSAITYERDLVVADWAGLEGSVIADVAATVAKYGSEP